MLGPLTTRFYSACFERSTGTHLGTNTNIYSGYSETKLHHT